MLILDIENFEGRVGRIEIKDSGKIITIDKETELITGFSKEELVGQTILGGKAPLYDRLRNSSGIEKVSSHWRPQFTFPTQGVPDERLGEKLCCSISLKELNNFDESAFNRYLKDYIANFKIPEYYDLHQDKLPRTASGKIYKLRLRDETKAKLNITD